MSEIIREIPNYPHLHLGLRLFPMFFAHNLQKQTLQFEIAAYSSDVRFETNQPPLAVLSAKIALSGAEYDAFTTQFAEVIAMIDAKILEIGNVSADETLEFYEVDGWARVISIYAPSSVNRISSLKKISDINNGFDLTMQENRAELETVFGCCLQYAAARPSLPFGELLRQE